MKRKPIPPIILEFGNLLKLRYLDGASLVYTSVSVPNSLPTLIHSMLGVYSQLKKQTLKHNVIDRDKVLIPPNWDSWGKIRVLREGFDVEGISSGWSIDVQQSPRLLAGKESGITGNEAVPTASSRSGKQAHVLPAYEDFIKDPTRNGDTDPAAPNQGVEIEIENTQEFLARQLEIMERLKAEEEKSQEAKESRSPSDRPLVGKGSNPAADRPRLVDEHIGPVQFNFGGIQVDSDGISRKPKDRSEPTSFETDGQSQSKSAPGGTTQNEALANFFAGLLHRGPT